MPNLEINMGDAYTGLTQRKRKNLEKMQEEFGDTAPARTGLFLTDDDEDMPVFAPKGGCEVIYARKQVAGNKAGARIVLTKDNYGHVATGLGGAGGTRCEAIDIVAGHLTSSKKIRTSETKSRANFAEDGARIYLTERGTVNHYFATENSDPLTAVSDNLKSGIGIKADHTLVIGRERVRILAGLGKFTGDERLATGGVPQSPKIEIGLTTEDNYQPAVRGDNLIKYLYDVKNFIDELAAKVDALESDLSLYQIALAGHVHVVAGAGPSTPSASAAVQGLKGVRKMFAKKLDGIVEEFHKAKIERQYLGTKSGALKGVPSDYILSNTVFIGR